VVGAVATVAIVACLLRPGLKQQNDRGRAVGIAKITDFIRTLQHEDLDQSFEMLSKEREQYSFPGAGYSRRNADLNLGIMLSSRRSTKVIQSLAVLPLEEREARCEQMFLKALQTHTNAVLTCLLRRDEPAIPKAELSCVSTKATLCAVMFATAELAREDLVSAQFQDIDEFGRVLDQYIAAHGLTQNKGLALAIRHAVPDKGFQLNVLRLLALRQGAPFLQGFDRKCQEMGMKMDQLPIVAWDAPVTYFERGLPGGSFEMSKAVTTYSVLDWMSMPDEERVKLLQELRSAVLHTP
jgi:hypothetical protein